MQPKDNLKSWLVVAVRLLTLIFAIVVFGCIANSREVSNPDLYNINGTCVYNGDDATCRLGLLVGVFAFSLNTVLIIFDVVLFILARESREKWKKPFSLLDMLLSFILAIVWFAVFVILARGWSAMDSYTISELRTSEHNGALAAVVFSFFSFLMGIVHGCVGIYRVFVAPGGQELVYEKL